MTIIVMIMYRYITIYWKIFGIQNFDQLFSREHHTKKILDNIQISRRPASLI